MDHTIHFAVKANSNLGVLRTLANAGSGFDIVSSGELQRVIAAGGDPSKCVFAGVGKTEEDIELALKEGNLRIQRRERAGTNSNQSKLPAG